MTEIGPKPLKPSRPKRCGTGQELKDFSRPYRGSGLSLRRLGALRPFFDVLLDRLLMLLKR